jgi:hypothetical protein
MYVELLMEVLQNPRSSPKWLCFFFSPNKGEHACALI